MSQSHAMRRVEQYIGGWVAGVYHRPTSDEEPNANWDQNYRAGWEDGRKARQQVDRQACARVGLSTTKAAMRRRGMR